MELYSVTRHWYPLHNEREHGWIIFKDVWIALRGTSIYVAASGTSNGWQSLSAEWQPPQGGTALLAALRFRGNGNSNCTVAALVEPNGPMVLLYNHGALANISLVNKMAFTHPQLHMNYCRVHQKSCFLHSPCGSLLSLTPFQSNSSLWEADRHT